ncbi:MAG: DUF1573 domain-containing protein [Deltaproteobacteria bacterium]|jgi:hypothetical protein|nr:DUF1573 domain-containing protein [Deltaproteobacteria bacterium]
MKISFPPAIAGFVVLAALVLFGCPTLKAENDFGTDQATAAWNERQEERAINVQPVMTAAIPSDEAAVLLLAQAESTESSNDSRPTVVLPPEGSDAQETAPAQSQESSSSPEDGASAAAGEPPLAPVLVLPETDFYYGEAKPSTTIFHDFVVKNEGQADLTISNVVPGCGCSVASFTSFIPPGHEGKVTLSVDLYAEWAGHNVNKSASILSNDPVNPTTRITIRAVVLEK